MLLQLVQIAPLRIELRVERLAAQPFVGLDDVDADATPTIFAGLQLALGDQVLNEGDGAQFGDQRGVEDDLVQPVVDFARLARRLVTLEGIERQQQNIVRRVRIEEGP